MLGLSRDIQILPTTLFPFVLRKAYFDCPERLLHSMVGTLHLIEGGEGSGVCTRRFSPCYISRDHCCWENVQCIDYPMYTETLYNFLVMAMVAKITRDLSTVTSCIDLSVRIVTKYPKVEPPLISSLSLGLSLRPLQQISDKVTKGRL